MDDKFSIYTYNSILVCNREFEEQRENKRMKLESDSEELVTPFSKAGFFSRMSFWWLNPLMKKGRKKL